jgi:diguanylate cyclase (GGDEF)-like protein
MALIIDNKDWSARSLESVLTPAGYDVIRVKTGMNGVARARAHPPDVILMNFDLPDGNAVGLCHLLRDEQRIGPSIPIVVLSTGHATRQQRLAALEAGAWEFLTYPFDAQELLLRLDGYTAAKAEVDRVKQESLVDDGTALYTGRGLERRAEELRSLAFRQGGPLACLVIAPAFESGQERPSSGADVDAIEDAIEEIAEALRDAGRVSDAIGRLGRTEFAIVAPATDAAGAVKMAERLAAAIHRANNKPDSPHFSLRAGYEAVSNVREAQIEAHDLLERAAIAMRRAKPNGEGEWLMPFEMEEDYRH